MNKTALDMTQPLPGWVRYRNTQTGMTIDLNPCDATHQKLLMVYRDNPVWQQIAE
jgi:hypothetical protein